MKHALAWLSLAIVVGAACDDAAKSHVYVAQPYEAAGDCLDPSTTLDTIATEEGSSLCAPVCLVSLDPSGTLLATYVSTMCGPYPASLDVSGTDPSCALALTAYANGNLCGSPTDAGGDDGGGDDSTTGDDDSATGDDGSSGDDASGDDASADTGTE